MQKIIELESGNNIRIICEDDIFIIQKGYIDPNGAIKTIEFIKRDDYNFNAFTILDDNKVEFEFDKNDPLYSHLNKLLNEDNKLVIDDDLTREENKKTMTIYKQQDKIIVSIENNLDNVSFIDKFNICIINIAYDQRSKIDQQQLDTKERLKQFFNDIYINFLGEIQSQKIKNKKFK